MAKTIRTSPASDYRQRVTILKRRTGITNELGEAVILYDAIQERWAKVSPRQAKKLDVADGVQTQITHDVELHYTPDIAPQDRLEFDGKQLEIASLIDPDSRHLVLRLECIEQNTGV